MGLVYSSSESSQLITSLNQNIKSLKETVNQLREGSHQIVLAVDGKNLSGATYAVAKGLFSELIIPTITRVTTAFDTIEQELQTYQSADEIISSEGSLDEDKLMAQIRIKSTMKISLENSAVMIQTLAKNNPTAQVIESLANAQQKLTSMANDLAKDIRQLEQKLEKLHQFSDTTSSLFSTSLSDLNLAMQGVLVLDNTVVNNDGSYELPKGTDKNWFSFLQSNGKVRIEQSSTTMFLELYKQISDLLDPINGEVKSDNIKRVEMLLKLYPAATIKKLLGNDEFWMLANYLPSNLQTKLINGLVKFEDFGKVVSSMKWIPKVDTIGKAYEYFGKFTNPVKTFVGESLKNSAFIQSSKQWGVAKGLGKVATVATYAQLGVTFVSSGINEYGKTGSIGKGILGGAIDTVKSIGPLEGMTIGAAGGPVGAVVGGAAGLINVGVQFIWPNAYGDLKNGAYNLYDKGTETVKKIGKGISQGVDTVKSIGKDIGNAGKKLGNAVSSIQFPKLKLGY